MESLPFLDEIDTAGIYLLLISQLVVIKKTSFVIVEVYPSLFTYTLVDHQQILTQPPD